MIVKMETSNVVVNVGITVTVKMIMVVKILMTKNVSHLRNPTSVKIKTVLIMITRDVRVVVVRKKGTNLFTRTLLKNENRMRMEGLGRSSHMGTFQQPGAREIEMAERMMEKVGITRLAYKDCNRMSGGELQMVLIARALINEPQLIILDEPETGLDFHNQILVLDMVKRLSGEEGISAIMNTHYPTNAMSVSDEAFMMNHKGRFFYGPTREVLTEENISQSFDVRVLVSDLVDNGRHVRSIVPVALTAN